MKLGIIIILIAAVILAVGLITQPYLATPGHYSEYAERFVSLTMGLEIIGLVIFVGSQILYENK